MLLLWLLLLQMLQNALLGEVGILAKLTHPNLVRFCGVCLDPPLVVTEYFRNGSMFKMLECARAAVQQGRADKVRRSTNGNLRASVTFNGTAVISVSTLYLSTVWYLQ
jgi:hypothetical protein